MGGVYNGQPVDEAVTDAAFLYKNADDTTGFKLSLNDSGDVITSGPAIDNIQREFNAISAFTGKATNVAKNTIPAWSNNDVGTSVDTLKDRADYLTQKFNSTTGHKHTGLPGDAPRITASDLTAVPLAGYFSQGTDLTGASGLSTNVSSYLSGKTASSGSTVTGVVVTAPYNKVVLRYATGSNANDEILDTAGNQVYGRLTNVGLVWTLTYYVDLSGTETAYSLPSTNVRWYYQELYNPMLNPPVYNTMAFIPSDNTTADVLDATTTVAGKVVLGSSAPPAIAATGALGALTSVAREDHTHEGVHSLAAYGVAGSTLKGDVQLEPGTNIVLSYSGGRIKIDGTGAQGVQEQPAGVVNGSNKLFGPLTQTPTNSTSIVVFLDGIAQENSLWSLVGNSIQFVTAPATGQKVYVFYITAGIISLPPAPTGTLNTEYRHLTSGEILAKQLTLATTPATPQNLLLDVIGGTAQEFNVDFAVAGSILSWNGYGLDGVLSAGDVLRIQYYS